MLGLGADTAGPAVRLLQEEWRVSVTSSMDGFPERLVNRFAVAGADLNRLKTIGCADAGLAKDIANLFRPMLGDQMRETFDFLGRESRRFGLSGVNGFHAPTQRQQGRCSGRRGNRGGDGQADGYRRVAQKGDECV